MKWFEQMCLYDITHTCLKQGYIMDHMCQVCKSPLALKLQIQKGLLFSSAGHFTKIFTTLQRVVNSPPYKGW